MRSLDLPLTEYDYGMMTPVKNFTIIYPSDHPFSQTIDISTIVRVLSYNEEDYLDLYEQIRKPTEVIPLDGRLCEIDYIRECKLKSVTPNEWLLHFGPKTLRDYLKIIKNKHPEDFFKIIKIKRPAYSLKELNSIVDHDR